jgi:heptaprenyl diphosphate synthase
MPLPDDRYTFSGIERATHFALFAVFAIGVHALESLLTLPVPWFRLGLTHIVTMLLLPFYGSGFILGIFLVRVVVGSAIVGKLFSPGFILAFGGGLTATLAMIWIFRIAGRHLSFLGISLVGAWTHNLIQVILATLIIQQASTLLLLPYFLGFAVITGSINGLLTNRILTWKETR